ncbi:hypothetical protein Cgig2_009128 [Carnegiea gigantea]|uniref:Uncharacterized protein n=1 Tax=Carnegiea gigantea TaxID=171969 RepID=A0A9Q1QAV9_9CARY|nr:hypothetical protein Cgig2_009128 [Carnegiea gigantea]
MMRYHYSLVADAAKCFMKKPTQVLCPHKKKEKKTFSCMLVTKATALEQRIDGIDDRIDKLGPKSEALQKATNDNILELAKKWNGRTHVPRRMEPEDIGYKPNVSKDDEYYHEESDGPQPYSHRDQGYPRNQIHDYLYDVTRKVKVDVPNFDGGRDLNAFVDWLDRLEDSFEFYIMNDIHRLNLKQLNTTLVYYTLFEKIKLRCAVREEQWVSMTRFINGLRDDLKGELSQPLSSAKSSSLTLPPLLPSLSLSSLVCHKCHEQWHLMSRCPNHTLTIRSDSLKDDN